MTQTDQRSGARRGHHGIPLDGNGTRSSDDLALYVPCRTSVSTLLALTDGQRATLADRVRAYAQPFAGRSLRSVDLWLGAWGLPAGWVAVRFEFADGGSLDGGLPPEGGMQM